MARKFRRSSEPQEEKTTQKIEIKKDVEIIPQPEPVIETVPDEPKILIEEEKPQDFAEPHFEFQDEYHFGRGDNDAVIDALPEEHGECVCTEPCVCDETCTEPCTCDESCVCVEEKIVEAPKTKSINNLSPAELRAYQRTGRLPK